MTESLAIGDNKTASNRAFGGFTESVFCIYSNKNLQHFFDWRHCYGKKNYKVTFSKFHLIADGELPEDFQPCIIITVDGRAIRFCVKQRDKIPFVGRCGVQSALLLADYALEFDGGKKYGNYLAAHGCR